MSDFAFAEEEKALQSLGGDVFGKWGTSTSTIFTYFFISLPLHVTAATGSMRIFGLLGSKYCSECSQDRVCRGVAQLLSFALLGVMAFAFVMLLAFNPGYFYFVALFSTIMVLSVKVVALFVHGPEMKKLSTRMTSSESQYESSLQLMLVLAICFTSGTTSFTFARASSMLSSVVMIGKSGAECYLTFGVENLIEQTEGGWRGLLQKIKLLATYAPVFIATASSRLTAFAVLFAYERTELIALVPLSLVAPSLIFSLVKPCGVLKDLSVHQVVEAVLGEQTTHSLWGGRGRERSKQLQLFMQIYLLLLHSILMVLVLLGHLPDFGRSRTSIESLRPGAIVSLSAGWLSRVVLRSTGFKVSNFNQNLRELGSGLPLAGRPGLDRLAIKV